MKPPTRFHSFPTKDRHLFVQFWVDMQSSQNEGFSSGFWSPKMGQTIIRMSSWWVVGILAGSWVDPKDHNLLPSNEDLCGIEAARAAGLCAQRLAQQQGATAAKCAEDAGDFKGGVGWVGWIGWVSGRGDEEKFCLFWFLYIVDINDINLITFRFIKIVLPFGTFLGVKRPSIWHTWKIHGCNSLSLLKREHERWESK